ncbi:patellin-4-like [Phalaenopsis equestris]|uniref:patellin-4-like n=1 Tax=Phalaenopsis equestris TaxID=78828 RepID=UPI0009E32FFC|nr:patellin-4-like [Phalaenopsis equestris]
MEELKPSEKKTLHDLKLKLEESIKSNHLFFLHPISQPQKRSPISKPRIASCSSSNKPTSTSQTSKISLWGIPLLPSASNDCLDTILLKFLRAREFRLCETFEMIQRTLRWRKEYGIDGILKEDLDSEYYVGTAYMDGFDREGHPVCYNVYGSLREDGMYEKVFGSREKQERFLRWRVQFMERGIQEFVSFKLGEVSAMVQVIDLRDLLGSSVKELRGTVEKMIRIFQDNYPEFIFKNIFLNASLRCYTYRALLSPLLSHRTESKFAFARPSKVTETLLRYIDPQNIPIQYGGFKRQNDAEFLAEDETVSETFVKGGSITLIEIPIFYGGVTAVWDMVVVGWEVVYREEFIPEDEGSYKILIKVEKKLRKPARNSFYIHEPGKLVFTIENKTSDKKSIFYRYKFKPTIPCYTSIGRHPIR